MASLKESLETLDPIPKSVKPISPLPKIPFRKDYSYVIIIRPIWNLHTKGNKLVE